MGSLLGEPLPQRIKFGDIAAALTNLAGPHGGPSWELGLTIGVGSTARSVVVPLQPFLTPLEYTQSKDEPFHLARLANRNGGDGSLGTMWLFRDCFYVTERFPTESETEEVVLRIKALHYRRSEEMNRLREEVANFEAVERRGDGPERKPIPDDVKLVVWSRDGGTCVKCGSSKDLHFDHIIAVALGGSNEAENIQLLCRACNLSKGPRLI
jgi:5-methylcytosine-specific restriction endonuclease McrA